METDNSTGIPCHYLKTQDGGRIYILPGVPANQDFTFEKEGPLDLEKIVSTVSEGQFDRISQDDVNRIRKILEAYRGRMLDAASVLFYAVRKGQFNEFAERLEKAEKEFSYIHPDMRMARTDITSFFLQAYVDLGVAPEEKVRGTIELPKKYGPGLLVYPAKNLGREQSSN